MSGFTENRASGASDQAGGSDRIMTWHASRSMLPLVGRIAADILAHHGRLTQLRTEARRLEVGRRELDWPARHRRYVLEDEIKLCETELRSVVAELESLGVSLLDSASGLVGFPTMVNDRRAYFSWQPGEEVLGYWNYAGDSDRQPVPEEWALPRQPRGRSKPRRR